MFVMFNASVLVRKKNNAGLMADDFKSLVSFLCLFLVYLISHVMAMTL
jgi:hypothetical protein